MGLDIHARATGGHLSGGYSRLHYTTRYLALKFCAMPDFLDDKDDVSAMSYFMYPYTEGKYLSNSKLTKFNYSLMLVGRLFPNIMFHSDCGGTYTKDGQLDLDGGLLTGNSIELLKELELLVYEEDFQDSKYDRAMEYTKEFYELVKKEVEDGEGLIEFS